MSLFYNIQPVQSTSWQLAISDLKIDQLLGLKPETIAKYICFDANEIIERQKIFEDCINNQDIITTLKQIKDNIKSINRLYEKENIYSESLEKIFYEVRSFQIYIDSINSLNELYNKKKDLLGSARMIKFLENFHMIHESEDYLEICLCLKERLKNIENIKSVTVGINLNMALEPREMGILSINNYSFVSSSYFQKKLTGFEKNKHMLAPLIKFESDNNLLERSLYLTINKILAKSLKKYNYTLSNWLQKNCDKIINVSEEIEFFCSCMNFLNLLKEKGGLMCFPNCDDVVQINGAYNPLLLRKKTFREIVSNDISWNFNDSYIFVLTGANSGGKSVFVESVGICQILFQLGMIVPAQNAHMKPVGCIHTHFSTLLKNNDEESRFTNECIKIKRILENVQKNDMLLMDETFSSTGASEGAAVAYHVLKRIKELSCMCLFSTHIHGLIHYLPSINEGASSAKPMHVECINGIRTFRVVYGAYDESSHAYEIAQKYGLTFEKNN